MSRRSSGGPPSPVARANSSRERLGVIGIAALVVITVAGYLIVRSAVLETSATERLLPFQSLAGTMVGSDQAMFAELRQHVSELERRRGASRDWPAPDVMRTQAAYRWTRSRDGFLINYLGIPAADPSAAAWLIVVQEPDPQVPVDTAPNDETHHRLPDGTVLHVTIWTHRFGEQVARAFVGQPEMAGWTQILTAPVRPVAPPR